MTEDELDDDFYLPPRREPLMDRVLNGLVMVSQVVIVISSAVVAVVMAAVTLAYAVVVAFAMLFGRR